MTSERKSRVVCGEQNGLFKKRGVLLLLSLSLSAWAQPVDRAWFEAQIHEELERQRKLMPGEGGLLHPNFDVAWQRLNSPAATVVSQTRLLYVQSVGFRLTGNKEYQDNVRAAADFLLEKFADSEYGGWYRRVSPAGEVLDDKKDSYSFAFVIYGCVNAWRATRDQRYLDSAQETWRVMKRHLRDGDILIKPATTRDFTETRGVNSQNPMMHLFEALLELYEATGRKEIRDDAQHLADAILSRLVRQSDGYLPELYDTNWKPLPIKKGSSIEVGHQFEWAWLLSRAVELGFPKTYLESGHRFLDNGLAGYDRERGGIYSRLNYECDIIQYRQGRWEQCEFLRAVIRYATQHGRDNLWGYYQRTMKHVEKNFIDPKYGGWRKSWYPDRPLRANELMKSTEWPYGYHVVNFYLEAIGLSPSWGGE